MHHIGFLPVIGAAAAVLLASQAKSQEYSSSSTYVVDGRTEEVTVIPPRYSPWQSDIGAPYRVHSMSVPVSYHDLNLHTGEGVYTLRQRVKYAARFVCDKLTFRDPVGLSDTDGCYYRAVTNAGPAADAAVWNYRSP